MASCTFLGREPQKRNAHATPGSQPPRRSQRLQERHARTQLDTHLLEKPPTPPLSKSPNNKKRCVRNTRQSRRNSSRRTIPGAKVNPWVLGRLQKWLRSRPRAKWLLKWRVSRSMFPTWKFQMPPLAQQLPVVPPSAARLGRRKPYL